MPIYFEKILAYLKNSAKSIDFSQKLADFTWF